MTKQQQYNEYTNYGGTMSIEEWEKDGRYDKSAEKKQEAKEWRAWKHFIKTMKAKGALISHGHGYTKIKI